MTRRLATLAALLAVTAPLLAACGAKKKLSLAAIPPGDVDGQLWPQIYAGALSAARAAGCSLTVVGSAEKMDAARQAACVEEALAKPVDALLLAPADRKALVPAIDKAEARKVPVVLFAAGADSKKVAAVVGDENYEGGVLAARRVAELLGKKGKVAVVGGASGCTVTGDRESGFQETLAKEFPDVQVADFQFGGADADDARKAADGILDRHADLGAVFASSGTSTLGAVRAGLGRPKEKRVKVVGFDYGAEVVMAYERDGLDALVLRNATRIGSEAVKAAVAALTGGAPAPRVGTGLVLVTRKNLKSDEVQDILKPPVVVR